MSVTGESLGVLAKLQARIDGQVEYALCLGEKRLPLNEIVGKTIQLSFTGNIFCIQCGRKTNKSFQQGHCFPCYKRLLECQLCILHPERCLIEKKPCPKDDWAHTQCHQSHIIYLANTSELKIGITRVNQIPTRWIDQGAVQAVPLWRVNNRYRAGLVEVACKAFMNDKTNWRKMLKNEVTLLDMQAVKQEFIEKTRNALADFDLQPINDQPITLQYPVKEYSSRITSLSFDKTPEINATLLGIKGQYLLLDQGVLNIRKFGGYEITFKKS